ncbi:ATP-binding protein [Alkalibacterium sp.]|nr:MAG: PAS domain S-box protein [Alkalibacterium sp.]
MIEKGKQRVKIKHKFYKFAALLLALIIFIMSVGIFTLVRAQSEITDQYEESTLKYNAINNLDESLTQVLFRARGYYAFQDQGELELLDENLDIFRNDIDYFQTLSLSAEEEELNTILSNFYINYTENLLPLAISFVDDDDYESLRDLSSGGTNTEINRFLDYTQSFNEEANIEREAIFDQGISLINGFTTGFIVLGLTSFALFFLIIKSLLKEIIDPLDSMILATNDLRRGRSTHLDSNYQLAELSELAYSFNEMAVEVQDKEEELTAQNEELLSQQDELEFNQKQLQEYVTEVEHINKALNQSALLCITDEKGIILNVNDMFSKISQFSKEELIGHTTRILKSGKHDQTFYENLWQTITKGKIWTGKMQNETKFGECYWLNATIVPFLDDRGKAYRFILIGIDITENKRNELTLKTLLSETQKAKEKTESYSNLNKELTATVDRDEFLDSVFDYFKLAFAFDKGMLVSIKQKQFALKGVAESHAERFLTDDYLEDILERLKSESYIVIKREAYKTEKGISLDTVYSYDLYAAVKNDQGEIELVLALTRIGHPFTEEEISEMLILLGQLSIALSRINIYEDVQKERSLNESIVQNVTEGLQLVSLEGDMLQANDKLLKLVDIESYKINKTIPKDTWINDFTDKCKDTSKIKTFFTESIAPDAIELNSIRCQMNDDKSRYFQIYTSPVFIEGIKTGTIFMYRDITKEYEVDAMKSELVSTVSHELRTPLSSVLGFTEMLLMKDLKPEKQKKYLETIFKEAKRLTNLINDFLDVQRIESGKQEYDMEELTLNKILIEVIDTFKHEKNHPIYLEDSANLSTVLADKGRLIQLFTNLISNAIKFSPSGGKIAIQIKNKNNQIVINVKDKGIGIPESELSDIFTKFKRIDNSASKKIGGTGLGLAISKGIVEAHQGQIWMESKEHKGTKVTVTFPVLESTIEDDLLKKEFSHGFESRGNVLLVEDDISMAMMLSESLKSYGFNVIHYLNNENIVEIVKERKLLGIVVDLMLEDGISGWDLIHTLQKNEETKNIPIIVSSAIEKNSDIITVKPVYDYLVKPYSPEVLSKLLIELSEKNEQ